MKTQAQLQVILSESEKVKVTLGDASFPAPTTPAPRPAPQNDDGGPPSRILGKEKETFGNDGTPPKTTFPTPTPTTTGNEQTGEKAEAEVEGTTKKRSERNTEEQETVENLSGAGPPQAILVVVAQPSAAAQGNFLFYSI